MTITNTPAAHPDRSATLNVLRVPASLPTPQPWPLPEQRADPGQNQPPLPWSDDRPLPRAPVSAVAADRGPTVRTVEFGQEWAGAAPAGLPAARSWAVRLASVLVEALQGRRPLGQLNRWLTPAALATLTHQVRRRSGSVRLRLQTVHLHRTTPAVVEAVALYSGAGAPLTPVAFRLEARRRQWVCTALDVQPREDDRRAAAGAAITPPSLDRTRTRPDRR